MKKYLILTLLIAVSGIFSCNKQLDLAPENRLVDKDVFKTEAGTEQALAEVYYNLFEATTENYAYTFGDFTTTILQHTAYFNTWDLGDATAADEITTGIWTDYFKAINKANNVIAKIPEFARYSEGKKATFIAECKFIRAYCYLDLLKFFGDGALTGKKDGLAVPLQLTPFEGYNTGDIIPRATNATVYAQIIKDLTDIIPLLPDLQANDLKTRSRATKGGANALLARCNLYKGDYEAAAATAKNTIDKIPVIYSLTTNLRTLFPSNPNGGEQTLTPEYVLAIPVSYIKSSSTSENNNIASGYYFKNSFWITPGFLTEFEPGDRRKSELIWKGDSIYTIARLGDVTTFKFNNSNGFDNVSLIRLAEVILTRAEALARTTGITTEAVGLLNEVRLRAIPSATAFTVSSFASANALIDEIMKQRKFEMAFEGHYRYDLIRTGKPLDNPDIPEGKKVLPIPQIEIDISKGIIKQNPGYLL